MVRTTNPPCALRVLVVDDERPIVDALRMVLADEFEVVGFTSAADALAQLDAGERFDVVLCDLTMPEISGMAFFAALDAEHRARVVFLTGGAFTPASRAFLAGLPNRWIEKPFPIESLRNVVLQTGARAD